MGSTANREAEVLSADCAAEIGDGTEPAKKQRPLAIVTERYRAELASSRIYERPLASLRGRRGRTGDLSMPDGDGDMAADDLTSAAACDGNGEREQDGDATVSRGRRERSRSASP